VVRVTVGVASSERNVILLLHVCVFRARYFLWWSNTGARSPNLLFFQFPCIRTDDIRGPKLNDQADDYADEHSPLSGVERVVADVLDTWIRRAVEAALDE